MVLTVVLQCFRMYVSPLCTGVIKAVMLDYTEANNHLLQVSYSLYFSQKIPALYWIVGICRAFFLFNISTFTKG